MVCAMVCLCMIQLSGGITGSNIQQDGRWGSGGSIEMRAPRAADVVSAIIQPQRKIKVEFAGSFSVDRTVCVCRTY